MRHKASWGLLALSQRELYLSEGGSQVLGDSGFRGRRCGCGFVDVRAGVQAPGEIGQLGWHQSKGVWGGWGCPSNLTPFSILQSSPGFFSCPSPGIGQPQGSMTCPLFRGLSSPENFYDTPSSPRNDYFTLTWGVASLGVACRPE